MTPLFCYTEEMRKAFDFSNWTRIPTGDDLDTLRALGYTTGIVGASFNVPLARLQIAALIAGGFRVEIYCWLRHPWRADLLQNAIDACIGFSVDRFWLDVEDAEDAMGKTPDQLAFDVEAALAYLRGRLHVEIGIYTGSWFWDAYMETTNTFECRLWLANYVTNPLIDPVTKTGWIYQHLPGGWTPETFVIWQWRNNLKPGSDFNADDNLILLEDDMTTEETAAAIKAYVDPKTTALYLNAVQNGADIMAHGDQIKALALAFAAHVQAGSIVPNAFVSQALYDQIQAIIKRQDELEARARAAAAALAPPSP